MDIRTVIGGSRQRAVHKRSIDSSNKLSSQFHDCLDYHTWVACGADCMSLDGEIAVCSYKAPKTSPRLVVKPAEDTWNGTPCTCFPREFQTVTADLVHRSAGRAAWVLLGGKIETVAG